MLFFGEYTTNSRVLRFRFLLNSGWTSLRLEELLLLLVSIFDSRRSRETSRSSY